MEEKEVNLIGEYRVGISFNPSGNVLVDKIKQKTADLINLLQDFKESIPDKSPTDSNKFNYQEVSRLIALAQTHYEDSAMWAVKAVTKNTYNSNK